MKTVINLFACILVIGSIFMNNSCLIPDDMVKVRGGRGEPFLLTTGDTTLTLPATSIYLSVTVDQNYHPDTINMVEWKLINPTQNNVIIDSPYSLKTNVRGFTKPGLYQFEIVGYNDNGTRLGFPGYINLTVYPEAGSNNFRIGSIWYQVQSIKREDNRIIASSFRNGNDSG